MKDLGQLFITGISGLSLSDSEREFIQSENIGGVNLFANNFSDPGQLAELNNDIQTLRDEYPLFIAVDHEGGRVQRFKKGFTHFPSMLDLSKIDSPKMIFQAHLIMAEELKACGVNMNYSPVCDILTNEKNKVIGDRAFGETAEDVEKNISAAIRGLQTGGVLSCAKHFPGHGNTLKDSHFYLPLIKKTLSEIEETELIPFVKASKSRVEFIMMAHLQVDALDEDQPTTLSPRAYKYLREKLKYQKIIISFNNMLGSIFNQRKT